LFIAAKFRKLKSTKLKLVAFERWHVRKVPSRKGKIFIFQTESVISKMLWHLQ